MSQHLPGHFLEFFINSGCVLQFMVVTPQGKHGTYFVKHLLSRRSISYLSREQHTVLSKPKDAGIMKCFLMFSMSVIATKQHCLYLLVDRGSTTIGALSLLPFSEWFKAKDEDVWKSSLVSAILLKASCVLGGAEVNPPKCLWFSYFLVNFLKGCLMFAWHSLSGVQFQIEASLQTNNNNKT